jgi:protein phosphatase
MNLFAADSHPGRKRHRNEDCFLADSTIGLFLVADGIGGHADGEVAAAIVRDTVRADIGNGAGLDAAIQSAHRGVLAEIAHRGESNMGSTVVAAVVSPGEYDIAWVGDSRAYSFDGTLKQLSEDHSLVSEMLARGKLTPEQAATHPGRNMLSQSVGVSAANDVTPGRIGGPLHPGQQLLLCSDGLTNEVSDAVIEKIMGEGGSPTEQVQALIQAALDSGGRDTITVVVVGTRGQYDAVSARGFSEGLSKTDAARDVRGGGPLPNHRVLALLAVAAAAVATLVALEAF